MKKVSLSGSKRENVGKKDAAALRRAERVPAVLYGGEKQYHFSISDLEAKKIIFTPDVYVVELNLDGKVHTSIIKEVQQNPTTDKVSHIDFLEIADDKPVKVKLPLVLTGFSIGVRNGGKLRQHFRRVTCYGMIKDMPEKIEVDITNLRINGKTRISDLKFNGIQFLDAANAVVVAVQMARGASVAAQDAEGTEEA